MAAGAVYQTSIKSSVDELSAKGRAATSSCPRSCPIPSFAHYSDFCGLVRYVHSRSTSSSLYVCHAHNLACTYSRMTGSRPPSVRYKFDSYVYFFRFLTQCICCRGETHDMIPPRFSTRCCRVSRQSRQLLSSLRSSPACSSALASTSRRTEVARNISLSSFGTCRRCHFQEKGVNFGSIRYAVRVLIFI